MVMLPCPLCGTEICGGVEHTAEDCVEQQAAAAAEAAKGRQRYDAWKARRAQDIAAGKPLPPMIKLPVGRVVKPGKWKS